MNTNQTVLSLNLKELSKSIGARVAQSKMDIDLASDDFKDIVMTEVTQLVDGVTKTIKTVDYYKYEQASLEFKVGYAEKKGIALYLTDAKLNPTVNNAFSEFMKKVGDRHGIAKPTKPTESAQGKAEQREKAKTEKESLMALSYDNLQDKADKLRINGSKESMKEAVKLLDVIEAKKKAEEKALNDEFKAKHKLVKDLVGNCHNHVDLDMIIETLQNYVPVTIPSTI